MCEPGKLYGVSVGPGDPELLTLKAVRVITTVGFLAVPDAGSARRTALGIISDYARDQRIIDCKVPMTTDQAAIDAAMDQTAAEIRTVLDAGDDVAMITLGDAGVYSSFYSVCDRLRPLGYQVEVVPGVTSFCAAAASLNLPLVTGEESLCILPAAKDDLSCTAAGAEASDAPAAADDLSCAAAGADTLLLMKAGRAPKALARRLESTGYEVSMVENCGLAEEKLYREAESIPEHAGYFSLMIAKRTRG